MHPRLPKSAHLGGIRRSTASVPGRTPKRGGAAKDQQAAPTPQASSTKRGTTLGLATSSAPSAPAPVVIDPRFETHRVRPGETLTSIARRYRTTVDFLVRMNKLRNPDHISAGTLLMLPFFKEAPETPSLEEAPACAEATRTFGDSAPHPIDNPSWYGDPIEHHYVAGEAYPATGPQPEHVDKGKMRSCFIEGALTAIARWSPESIERAIPRRANADGNFEVNVFVPKLFGGYKTKTIEVTPSFIGTPESAFQGNLCTKESTPEQRAAGLDIAEQRAATDPTPNNEVVLWAALAHKAYAYIGGLWNFNDTKRFYDPSEADVLPGFDYRTRIFGTPDYARNEWGNPKYVLEAFTGRPASTSLVRLPAPRSETIGDTEPPKALKSVSNLARKIHDVVSNKRPSIVVTNLSGTMPLTSKHCYAVEDFEYNAGSPGESIIYLRDPQGSEDGNRQVLVLRYTLAEVHKAMLAYTYSAPLSD